MRQLENGGFAVMPSEGSHEAINDLWEKWAIINNPDVWTNPNDMTREEIVIAKSSLLASMQNVMDGVPVLFEEYYQRNALEQAFIDIENGVV